jgi:hypothetical protein
MGVQVCMRIHPSHTLTLVGLRCGLPHPPSPSLLLSPSFPPSPAPSPPHLPPRPRDAGVGLAWYESCSLQVAAIRIRTRTLTEMEKRGCPCEHLLSLTVVLVIPSYAAGAVHTRYARDVDIEAGVCVCMGSASPSSSHSHGSSCDRSGVSVRIAAGVAFFFLRGYRGRTLRRFGYTFVFGCALARRGGGDGEFVWVRCGHAHILPAPPLPSLRLSRYLSL